MQTKHEFLRRTAAVIAAFFTLTFTGCGQTPESPGSLPVSGVVSETTAQSGQETAGVSNIYKKREPHVDKLEYEFNKTGNIDFYSGELYLNAIGDVVSGCDWSYKSQKKYRFGNVMNKNWLENISNSELYIAS